MRNHSMRRIAQNRHFSTSTYPTSQFGEMGDLPQETIFWLDERNKFADAGFKVTDAFAERIDGSKAVGGAGVGCEYVVRGEGGVGVEDQCHAVKGAGGVGTADHLAGGAVPTWWYQQVLQ